MEMMPRNRCFRTVFTAFPYQKPLRTKEFKEFVPTRKQSTRQTLVKKCIKFPTAKNRKGLAYNQNFTQKHVLLQRLLLMVNTLLVIGLFGKSKQCAAVRDVHARTAAKPFHYLVSKFFRMSNPKFSSAKSMSVSLI